MGGCQKQRVALRQNWSVKLLVAHSASFLSSFPLSGGERRGEGACGSAWLKQLTLCARGIQLNKKRGGEMTGGRKQKTNLILVSLALNQMLLL